MAGCFLGSSWCWKTVITLEGCSAGCLARLLFSFHSNHTEAPIGSSASTQGHPSQSVPGGSCLHVTCAPNPSRHSSPCQRISSASPLNDNEDQLSFNLAQASPQRLHLLGQLLIADIDDLIWATSLSSPPPHALKMGLRLFFWTLIWSKSYGTGEWAIRNYKHITPGLGILKWSPAIPVFTVKLWLLTAYLAATRSIWRTLN